MKELINQTLKKIKQTKPLIVNLTNQVTMDFIANGLLSIGASPVMTDSVHELEQLIPFCNAVVINVGTLNENFMALCHQACELANRFQKPLILDPVGVGASEYRRNHCLNLIETHEFSIIRGNASEISALSGYSHSAKGVDSTLSIDEALPFIQIYAQNKNIVFVISGQNDVILNGSNIQRFDRGSPVMKLVTGCGCLLTAVIAAFHAGIADPIQAATSAVLFYGISGEIAAKQSKGPGSFKVHFLDALSLSLNEEDYLHD